MHHICSNCFWSRNIRWPEPRFTRAPTLGKNVFFDLFYFEYEKNFTALFSGGLFIILSMFFHAIGKNNVASQKQWNFLKYVAIYLGCDGVVCDS